MEKKIIEHEDREGVTWEIMLSENNLEANLYFNFHTPDFYILFYNKGELYFPEGEEIFFHAKTWEVLKQYVNITLREMEFQNFMGILNVMKVKRLVSTIEKEYKIIENKERNPTFFVLS